MFCEKCGKELPNGTVFCTSCGAPQQTAGEAPVNETASSQTASFYQTPNAGFTPPVQNDTQNNYFYMQSAPKIPSMGSYILWIILTGIPVVNLIFSIIWAIDKSYPARANFFRAVLILLAISVVVGSLIGVLFGSLFTALFSTPMYGIW